ncbi:molecular chaperone DnaJ [Halopiger goleimassiliensis]|uniref:molecular chaperone DnaJ n=1 Tax=Halopiger goleimassiliensis TaxID=1293048 RepID=UPI000A596490|nr:molecular chaperone DnaJ [Halopiger goleimassiliensis]
MPLLWLSLVTYLAGLAQFALANESAVVDLFDDLLAVGPAPEALWETLSTGRHGIQTSVAFVAGVEPVTVPLEPMQWYAALGGIVAFALVVVGLDRLLRREETWGPITLDETVLVAAALGLSTGLLGGPLLAGAALMPFLFGVVVHHTRRGSGWTPSYLYVVPVLAPAAGLAAGVAGVSSLPIDLVAFVVVPVLGGLVLPVRAVVKKRFGR